MEREEKRRTELETKRQQGKTGQNMAKYYALIRREQQGLQGLYKVEHVLERLAGATHRRARKCIGSSLATRGNLSNIQSPMYRENIIV